MIEYLVLGFVLLVFVYVAQMLRTVDRLSAEIELKYGKKIHDKPDVQRRLLFRAAFWFVPSSIYNRRKKSWEAGVERFEKETEEQDGFPV